MGAEKDGLDIMLELLVRFEQAVERFEKLDVEDLVKRSEAARKRIARKRTLKEEPGLFSSPGVGSIHVVRTSEARPDTRPDNVRTLVPRPDIDDPGAPTSGTDAAPIWIWIRSLIKDQIDPRAPIVLIPCLDRGVLRVDKQTYREREDLARYDVDVHFADLLARIDLNPDLAPRSLASARSWCEQSVVNGAKKAGVFGAIKQPAVSPATISQFEAERRAEQEKTDRAWQQRMKELGQ